MSDRSLPSYPARALWSKAVLYRQLQDMDVYVEDEASEVFYTELLGRLMEGDVRIAKVMALRGRNNVLERAAGYNEKRPAIFLVDGDLYWVAGLPFVKPPHVYVHDCYCIENYLFCEDASIQIALENSGVLREAEIAAKLGWADWKDGIAAELVPLFVEFATAFTLCPEVPTVGRGIGCMLTQVGRGQPQLDPAKVREVRQTIEDEVVAAVGKARRDATQAIVDKRVRALANPLDVVSGKDYLLQLQLFVLREMCGGSPLDKRSLMFRLARHCRLDRLQPLRQEMLRMATQ